VLSDWNIPRKKGWFGCVKKKHRDSDNYLEETTWSLYSWGAKLSSCPFMQVKWETNKYARACNASESTYTEICNALYCTWKYICRGMWYNVLESTYAKACNAMYLKVHMRGYIIQCIGNYTLRYCGWSTSEFY